MWSRSETAVVICLTGLAYSCQAFDSMEHERVSDSALLLAFSYWYQVEERKDLSKHNLCDLLRQDYGDGVQSLVRHCSSEEEAITYGGTVRLVDELLYPSQLFVREGGTYSEGQVTIWNLPQSYLDLNQRFNKRWEKRKHTGSAILAGYRALSYNEIHFQNDLLQQMWRFKREATQTAEDNIYYSLVVNALSDHFLQDYLAPGHILWPRSHSHDSVATSVHDGTNQKGAWFQVDENAWDTYLKDLAKHLQGIKAESDERHVLERYWMKRRKGADTPCNDNDEETKIVGSPAEGLRCFEKVMVDDGQIKLFGDGLISKSPAQQMLLLLVQADQILQLLRRNNLEAPRKTQEVLNKQTPEESMIVSFDKDYTTLLVPCTGLEFGGYRFGKVDCEERKIFTAEEEERHRQKVFENSVSGVFLLGGGGQAPFRSVGSARYQFSLEYLPLGAMANSRFFRNKTIHKPPEAENCKIWTMCNTGVVVGLDYVHDGDFTAPGIGTRFIKAIPSINLQLSPYLKFLKYRFAQQDDWNVSWGLRADWGFSIGSFYITLGKEFFVNERTELQSTGMFSFGVGIGIPTSRARKWFFDNRRYRPEKDY